jgi:trigger factor
MCAWAVLNYINKTKMNITKENIEDLNAVLKISVEKPDYDGNVEKVLRDYRKKANIKGLSWNGAKGLIKKCTGKLFRSTRSISW